MDTETIVKTIIIEQLKVDENKIKLLPDMDLKDIGMDSIKFIKLIVEIESAFDIEYPDDKLLITESGMLKQIVNIVNSCLNKSREIRYGKEIY